ncbi:MULTISPECIES: hypothetical protein [unclassified Chelatococcus]|uniref:hypothetical protein n=1 Tax=unclassified Chelatococcus TaxID=2638111 RepID=UPI001BCE7AEA|nr:MULTISPECIES: hypothetical protein [unclassified Chelatococcus]MBS7700152.1 hypothetical protein [Chelatococcus sp. YT9]MBX3556845.1 hypothetical protein [Chelatococcus sp.]
MVSSVAGEGVTGPGTVDVPAHCDAPKKSLRETGRAMGTAEPGDANGLSDRAAVAEPEWLQAALGFTGDAVEADAGSRSRSSRL